MAPQVTILITTMDRRPILETTLHYVYETSTDEERDVWVWDNASSDDTPDFLGTLQGWPGVRCFRSERDVGIAASKRRMAAGVRTPYIFTLDDDVWVVNRGWVSAVARVLESDLSVGQVVVPQEYHHPSATFGASHAVLDRPFFRVPPIPVEGRRGEDDVTVPDAEAVVLGGPRQRGRDVAQVVDAGGERVVVPHGDLTQLPFAASGGAAGWRVRDVLSIAPGGSHPLADLREAWSFPIQRERGLREAVLVGYGCFHPSPGPLWHLGHGERYWEEKCRFAEAIYARSAGEQRAWLGRARGASGWGRPLDDPDEVLAP